MTQIYREYSLSSDYAAEPDQVLFLENLKPAPKAGRGIGFDVWDRLAQMFDVNIFVETGTYKGNTTDEAAKVFDEVHSIELSADLYQRAVQRFEGCQNIHLYCGDSGEVLSRILPGIKGRILFWLDAHFSGGDTVKGQDNTPILEELMIIKHHNKINSVIMIDDLRQFDNFDVKNAQDSLLQGYPSVHRLRDAILELDRGYQFCTIGDIAMAYPSNIPVTISPLLQACTMSRLFNGSNIDLETLFNAEDLIGSAKGIEKTVIQELHQDFSYFFSKDQGLGGHYKLWYGLILAGEGRHTEACRAFHEAIRLGCDHWRVSFYMAQAAAKAGDMALAREAAKRMAPAISDPSYDRDLPDHGDLKRCLMKRRYGIRLLPDPQGSTMNDLKTITIKKDAPEIAGKVRENILAMVPPENDLVFGIDPRELLSHKRFDLMAKYIYANHRELGIDSDWALRLYIEHLRVFNGFYEPDGTGKIGIDVFAESFHQILRTVKEHGFDDTRSLIPVGRDNIILDGSHRIAAGLLYGKKVTGLLCDAQAFEYDYRFFRHYTRHASSGLAAKWADAMAFEYCRLKDNTFIAAVFPSAIGKESQLQRILEGHGRIVFTKDVHLFNQGPSLLMRQMYKGEEWLGGWSNNFAGAQQKAGLCFRGNGPMKVFILETDDPRSLVEAKNEIRDLYKIGNHSVHINDTHEETIRLTQILLNDNGIDFLNHARPCYYQIFDALLEYFKDWSKRSGLDNECFCVGGSSVMAAYGIRSARDLDFLHFGHPDLSTGHPLVSSHNSEINHYTTTRDDIIFNPENHFYYDGIKFASLEIIRAMKAKRGETKDIRDVKIIDSLGNSPKPVRRNAGKSVAHDPGRPERADHMPNSKVINYVYAHTQAAGFSMHKGYTTVIWSKLPIENCDVYAYQDAFSYYGGQRGMNVLMMHEPVVALPGQYSDAVWDRFDYVFTSLDSLAEKGGKFRKFNHPAFDTPLSNTETKAVDLGYQQPLDQKEDAICMISGNKFSNVPGELYSKRVEIAKWFNDFSDIPFDVYGRPSFRELPNYKGELNPYTRKFEVLAKYRYSLCFENVYHPEWSRGYLTEKLLHCLMCGTIPIYLGCYNIEKYVPRGCFIDFRQFKNLAELESFIRSISNDTYNTYIRNMQNWVNKRNLNQYSIHRSYDKLLCLLDQSLSGSDLSQQPWLSGPSPEHVNSEWRIIRSPAVWSWADLANAASKQIILDNQHPETQEYVSQERHQGQPLTSIIILNFNGADHIKKCIESIRTHTPEAYELIVVDNASTDDSLEFLRAQPDITLVENTTNLGCPPARTQAMALAGGEYVLLLDNDTVVTPGWLTTLLGHARQNPNIGLIGPRSNFVSGQQLVPQVSYKGIQELNEFAREFSQQNKGHLTSTTRLVGFCMLIRRAVIDKVGAPDPRFGKFGFEDDDYTWRAVIAGFRAAIAHDVFIHHTGGPQLRGNAEYNNHLREAWNVFKRKWGLPPDLEYGVPFNIGEILSRPFNPSMHYVPTPARSEVEALIYHPDRGKFKAILADTTERVTEALSRADWFEAIDLLKAALEETEGGSYACFAGDISSLWNSLGYSYFSAGHISEAEDSFLKGLESSPGNMDLLNNLADLYFQQGQYNRAIEYLERALAIKPDDVNVLVTLGNCSLQLGAVDAALAAYRRVLAPAPVTAGVKEAVSQLEVPDAGASNGVIICD